MATMKNIADQLGISINAVSLALNDKAGVSEELRRQVLRTADEIGYISSKEKYVKTFRKTNLCIMLQKLYNTDLYFYSKVMFAVTDEARKNGYDSIVHFFDDSDMTIANALEEKRVAGLIVIGKISDENIRRLLTYQIPMILVDHASFEIPLNCVITDNKSGGYMACKYLLEKGFEDIGFFGDLAYSLSIRDRYFGFLQAIRQYAPHLEEKAMELSITGDMEHYVLKNRPEGIYEILKTRKVLPKAFVCSNDIAALTLCTALRRLYLTVPQDISLIGFDNTTLSEVAAPPLTTVNVRMSEMGKKAVRRLIQIISHKDTSIETIMMGVNLVIRDTVGMPFTPDRPASERHRPD